MLKTIVEDRLVEREERDKRKKNLMDVMIFNLQESQNPNPKQRVRDDNDSFDKLTTEGLNLPKIKITNVSYQDRFHKPK